MSPQLATYLFQGWKRQRGIQIERRHSSDFLDNHAKLNRKSAIYGMQSSEYLDLNQINFQIICGLFITMVMTIVLLVEK